MAETVGVIPRVSFILVLWFDVLISARRAWLFKRGPHANYFWNCWNLWEWTSCLGSGKLCFSDIWRDNEIYVKQSYVWMKNVFERNVTVGFFSDKSFGDVWYIITSKAELGLRRRRVYSGCRCPRWSFSSHEHRRIANVIMTSCSFCGIK